MRVAIIWIAAAVLCLFAAIAYAGMKMTSDGIVFPDKTTQTTAASAGSSVWNQSVTNIYYSSGNVGIGTSRPGEKLKVVGNIEVSGSNNGIKFPDGTIQRTAAMPPILLLMSLFHAQAVPEPF